MTENMATGHARSVPRLSIERAVSISFDFSCPTRIIFGAGRHVELKTFLPTPLGRIAFVRGASGVASAPVLSLLRSKNAIIVDIQCAQEPTVDTLRQAITLLDGHQVEMIVACGGGAVLDTAKALGVLLTTGRDPMDQFDRSPGTDMEHPPRTPCIALPTTAGTGAEVTANAVIGIPERGIKQSLRGRALYPAVAIVDPDLMRTAPAHVALGAGLDAVTQVVEAYLSNAASPFTDALSAPAIASGLQAVRRVCEDNDSAAWSDMAWVSLSSGVALANGGLGAAHGMAAVIGGQYDVPHGALCGRLLVPVLEQNSRHARHDPDYSRRLEFCTAEIAKAFPPSQPDRPLSGLSKWLSQQNLPRLREWGIEQSDHQQLAKLAAKASSSLKNGVSLKQADFVEILQAAS